MFHVEYQRVHLFYLQRVRSGTVHSRQISYNAHLLFYSLLAVLPLTSESTLEESDQETASTPIYTSADVCGVGCSVLKK